MEKLTYIGKEEKVFIIKGLSALSEYRKIACTPNCVFVSGKNISPNAFRLLKREYGKFFEYEQYQLSPKEAFEDNITSLIEKTNLTENEISDILSKYITKKKPGRKKASEK